MHVCMEKTIAKHLGEKISTPSRDSFFKSMLFSRSRSIWEIGMPCMRSMVITVLQQ